MRSYWWLAAFVATALLMTEFASDVLYASATSGKAIDENEFTASPPPSPPALKGPSKVAHPADNMLSGVG
jgi:hypothetical protein